MKIVAKFVADNGQWSVSFIRQLCDAYPALNDRQVRDLYSTAAVAERMLKARLSGASTAGTSLEEFRRLK